MIQELDCRCEHCGSAILDENPISIENSETQEMISVCGSCFRQLKGN